MSLCPDDVPLSVQPFGYAVATVTDANHVYIQFDACVVHGVSYRASLHMNKWADGTWRLGLEKDAEYQRGRNASYMSRVGVYPSDPTNSARKALEGRIACAVALAILKIEPAIFKDAEIRKWGAEVEKCQESVKKAWEVLRAAEDAEHAAQVALHLAKGGDHAEN